MNLIAPALWLVLVSPADETTATLHNRIYSEERALLEAQGKKGRVRANLEHIQEEQRSAQQRLEVITRDQSRLLESRRSVETKVAALTADLNDRRRAAVRRLSVLVRQSNARPLEMMLTANTPADFVYRYHALQALAKADRKLIDRLDEARLELDAQKRELDSRIALANARDTDARAETTRLEVLSALHRDQMAALQQESDEQQLWLAYLKEQARDLGVMLGRLPEAPKRLGQKGLHEPVAGGQRVAAFGQPDPLLGSLLPSAGWRYRAQSGLPVRAAAAGRVTFAGWFQGYGNLVVLDHGGSVNSLYAHLGELGTAAGMQVAAGDTVGATGATGSAGEPGVYFEVRRRGAPIDPAVWIRSASAKRKN